MVGESGSGMSDVLSPSHVSREAQSARCQVTAFSPGERWLAYGFPLGYGEPYEVRGARQRKGPRGGGDVVVVVVLRGKEGAEGWDSG